MDQKKDIPESAGDNTGQVSNINDEAEFDEEAEAFVNSFFEAAEKEDEETEAFMNSLFETIEKMDEEAKAFMDWVEKNAEENGIQLVYKRKKRKKKEEQKCMK